MEREDKHSIFHFNWKDCIAFESYKTPTETGNLKHRRVTKRITSSQHKLLTDIVKPASTACCHLDFQEQFLIIFKLITAL